MTNSDSDDHLDLKQLKYEFICILVDAYRGNKYSFIESHRRLRSAVEPSRLDFDVLLTSRDASFEEHGLPRALRSSRLPQRPGHRHEITSFLETIHF